MGTYGKEKIKINENFGDQTSHGPWNYEGNEYKLVDDTEKFGDGVEHTTILQRKSDGKYFKMEWCWFPTDGDYEFATELMEVLQKVSVKYE